MLISLAVSSSACEDFLDREPGDTYSESSAYQSMEDMVAALNNLYTFLPGGQMNPNQFGTYDLLTYIWTNDGLRRNTNGQTFGADLTWTASDGHVAIFYRYSEIRDINEFISRLKNAQLDDTELVSRMEKEARFIRAMQYERMLFAYGDVPLLTEPTPPDFFPERTPRRDVFDFVIAELDAIGDLPMADEYAAADRGRITRGAVLALKARAYLNAIGWHPDKAAMYAGAEAACEAIVNNGRYQLESGIEGFRFLFTKAADNNSSEKILETQYMEDIRTHDLTRSYTPFGSYTGPQGPDNNFTAVGATGALIESFQTLNGLKPADDPSYDPAHPWENRDPRFRASFILPGDTLPAKGTGELTYVFQPHPAIGSPDDDITGRVNPTGYNFRKYVDYTLSSTGLDYTNLSVIRYAEVLLMYAEALAGQGKDTEALAYLNMVRERVAMPAYTLAALPEVEASTGNDLIDAILLERRFEFVAEGPQRWLDIWRYKLGAAVFSEGVAYGIPKSTTEPGDLQGEKYVALQRKWDDRLYLLPIPLAALDANPSLTQNPGY